MAKSSKLDIVWIVLLAVAVVGLVLAIVGVCIDYVAYDVTLLNNTNTTSYTIGELVDAQNEVKDYTGNIYSGLGGMEAMAIITIVLSALTAICVALCKFVNIKFANIIKLALGALTVVFAIIAIILAYTFGDVAELYDWYAAAGAWLVLVGGILAGAAGVVAGLKK
ncbi:MAG: hypothetical protein LUF82_00455 [Clostridia bacterium]|nr:hypothetical protein [Clostridia bacterium]